MLWYPVYRWVSSMRYPDRIKKTLSITFSAPLQLHPFIRQNLHHHRYAATQGKTGRMATAVQELRRRTGVSIGHCHEALKANSWLPEHFVTIETRAKRSPRISRCLDIDAAIIWIRQKGISTAQKRESRYASEGLISLCISNTSASMFEVSCETDFVSRSPLFKSLVSRITETIDFASSAAIKISNISDVEQMQLRQPIDPKILSLGVSDAITEVANVVDEPILLRRLVHYPCSNFVLTCGYIHNQVDQNIGSAGALVSFLAVPKAADGEVFNGCSDTIAKLSDSKQLITSVIKQVGKQLSMQVVATQPKFIDPLQIDNSILESEKQILKASLVGKLRDEQNENEFQKLFEKRLNKFYSEETLLGQDYLMSEQLQSWLLHSSEHDYFKPLAEKLKLQRTISVKDVLRLVGVELGIDLNVKRVSFMGIKASPLDLSS